MHRLKQKIRGIALLVLSLQLMASGCQWVPTQAQLQEIDASGIPRELDKTTIPPYRVEPPDVLLIEAVRNVRPPDSPLEAGDQLEIVVSNTLPIDPEGDPIAQEYKRINRIYQVETNGTVDLGPEYGVVPLAGLTFEQAKGAIERHLQENIGLRTPLVSMSMPDLGGKQAISGEHLVRPDGTVALGIYGSVHVAGLTLDEIKQKIERHLSKLIYEPEVAVDVIAYNSKTYYVIADGGGSGEQVIRMPFTGNETVLDAISNIQGLPSISSKMMWLARPTPAGTGVVQNMPIDWDSITRMGVTSTNYQLLPGDRIYIKADSMVSLDNFVAKTIAPAERIFGFTLLGNGVVRRLQTNEVNNSNF